MKAISARLADFKKAKAAGKQHARPWRRPDWRRPDWRREPFGTGGQGNWFKSEEWHATPQYCSWGEPDLRGGQRADEVIRLNHLGWFADYEGRVAYFGMVYQLPGKGRAERWVAGYAGEESGSVILDVGHRRCIYEDRADAARAADSFAENAAESAREYEAKCLAEQDIEDARERIHQVNQQTLPIVREARATKLSPAICGAVKDRIRDLIAERREAFETIDRRQADYWSAVPQ